MTQLQEAFLNELKSSSSLTAKGYADLFNKYSNLVIEEEVKNGASEQQSQAMGNYYVVSVLSDFLKNENLLARVIHLSDHAPL